MHAQAWPVRLSVVSQCEGCTHTKAEHQNFQSLDRLRSQFRNALNQVHCRQHQHLFSFGFDVEKLVFLQP
jgi:hypothetical protein